MKFVLITCLLFMSYCLAVKIDVVELETESTYRPQNRIDMMKRLWSRHENPNSNNLFLRSKNGLNWKELTNLKAPAGSGNKVERSEGDKSQNYGDLAWSEPLLPLDSFKMGMKGIKSINNDQIQWEGNKKGNSKKPDLLANMIDRERSINGRLIRPGPARAPFLRAGN